MKQSLQLKLGQQLTMTPQLQQAIKLLQLSTLDLQQEIQQALDSNPLLEVDEHIEEPDATLDSSQSSEPIAENTPNTEPEEDQPIGDWSEKIPNDLPVDSQWEDVYQSGSSNSNTGMEESSNDFEHRDSSATSLNDHLLWQLNLTRFSDVDNLIAMAIIDATDVQGRLTLSAEDIWQSTAVDLDIELDEVMAVLHRLQQFDPPGVCSADLRECLLIQLHQLPPETPSLGKAKLIVDKYIALLGSRDYKQLMRRTRLSEDELRTALDLIQTLNPNPGESHLESATEYVIPDVFVSKKKNRWVVELNPDIAPKLRINTTYADMIKRADQSPDNTYLRDNLQEARWFLKSLFSRNETLLKVASEIVARQRGFLEYGDEAMKPMVLHDIADAVEMHESTISRVTTQKYMHTPRGIFELKYFFSSHVSTAGGGEASSTAIRALIKKLIAAENPRKPLSDNKITDLLSDKGIRVARRTIAKYRESMVIPPSNERKRLA
jgi:RNA polymerase sigma-54 factor